jgi:hypothetical protein
MKDSDGEAVGPARRASHLPQVEPAIQVICLVSSFISFFRDGALGIAGENAAVLPCGVGFPFVGCMGLMRPLCMRSGYTISRQIC